MTQAWFIILTAIGALIVLLIVELIRCLRSMHKDLGSVKTQVELLKQKSANRFPR